MRAWERLGLEVEARGDGHRLLGEATPAREGEPLAWSRPPWPERLRRGLRLDLGEGAWASLPVELLWGPTDERQIHLECVEARFQAPARALGALEYYGRRARLFDGAAARLAGLRGRTLRLQACGYFDYASTNLALDAPLPGGGRLRDVALASGALAPLEGSPLANAVGVSGLALTADGQLVIQRRAEDLLVRPGTLAGGFAGLLEWGDVRGLHGRRLADLDALRELREELGVSSDEIVGRRHLGLVRELARGGAPELLYLARLSLRGDELLRRVPTDPEGAVLLVPCAAGDLSELLHRVARVGAAPLSVPLVVALSLWWCARRRRGVRTGPEPACPAPSS